MKKWIALGLVLALCLAMVGCTGQEQSKSPPEMVEDFSGRTLKVGSLMPNFTIRDVDGNAYNLYELLEEKQMVMLNFWFIDCPYCVKEFPYMNAAYGQYADSVAIFALNPFDSDQNIRAFGAEMELNFTLCGQDLGMRYAFGVKGYPTTVVIDRYGVVCLVEAGMVPSEELFLKAFAHFTAEDYETELFWSFSEIQ